MKELINIMIMTPWVIIACFVCWSKGYEKGWDSGYDECERDNNYKK